MKKKFIYIATSLVFMAGLLITGLYLVASDKQSVTIESFESKTIQDKEVYNQIKYFSFEGKDVWMMRQSHQGIRYEKNKWDRLAIIVDKKNKIAEFMQLPPGELVWSDELPQKRIENRVACYLCHSNGPRVIRPTDSAEASLSWNEKVKIFFWNLKIKSYGQMQSQGKEPFRHQGKIENDKLQVKTCLICHSEGHFYSRGYLTRQNSTTISFMVKNKIMPPIGFSLSAEEEKQINRFMAGF